MKKLWLVVATAVLVSAAVNTHADVQNIRLSGDIRIRGYYLANAAEGGTIAVPNYQSEAGFITQRTRVSVEADLEDHVLVVVTLQAEGLWGADNETSFGSGAGTAVFGPRASLNRRWDLGVTEAYVQLSELFYSPATLKLGRQFLNYGHGLILSSADQEYNYDAGRLILDYYPVTIDLVGARLADFGAFGGNSSHPSADLLFVNARYEMSDSVLKDIEAYFGWLAQSDHNGVSSSRIPPSSTGGASPMIIGLRGDLTPTDAFKLWFEGGYEFGPDGTGGTSIISSFLANLGASFTLKDTAWTPSLHANYTYADGGGSNGRHTFVPWMDAVEGYNGYLFAPALSNIQIFNLGASVKPFANTTLSLEGYYYLKVDKDGFAGSNPNVDFGGLGFTRDLGPTNSKDLGWEIDTILAYDYSKDVRLQLVYGMFIPEGAYRSLPEVSSVAHEVRGEVSVRF